ncbi:hypothetical protein SAZ11_58030 [Streptomyces sp. FXJ1.4098]|nr:hypothetical protein [Streptomyces sp. FXJ1.4098]
MTFTHTLAEPRVEAAISRMFELAEQDEATAARLGAELALSRHPQELADAAAGIYMPISAEAGSCSTTWSVPSARPRSWSSACPSASPRSIWPPPYGTTAPGASSPRK